MLVLFTNLASLQTRAALERTQQGTAVTLQRLSTGLRINSARDDAAGLAVAARLDGQRRGTIVGARNANDAISLMQVGDQALSGMVDGLQRMRELAVQSLNSPLSTSDRQALDAELQQRLAELDRTAQDTTFNGRSLLDGSFGQATFQVGSGGSDTLGVDLATSMRTDHLGAIATATSADLRTSGGGFQFAGTYTTAAVPSLDFSKPTVPFTPGWTSTNAAPPLNYTGAGNATTFTVDGHSVTLNANYGSNGVLANAVQAQLDATAPGAYVVAFDASGHLRFTKTSAASNATVQPSVMGQSGNFAAGYTASSGTNGTAYSPTTNAGFDVDGHTVSLTANEADANALVADIQSQLDHAASGRYIVTGGMAGISIAHTGDKTMPQLNNFTGAGASIFGRRQANGLTLHAGEFSVKVGSAAAVDVTGTFETPDDLARAVTAQVPDVVATIDAVKGTLLISARDTITIGGSQGGSGGAVGFSPQVNPPSGNLTHIDVLDGDAARDAVLRIDAAIDQVTAQRGSFGALSSRFETIATQAQQDADIMAAAHGRVVDADMAVESSSYARSQVLQDAGMAMVAQANASSRDVLTLLQ